MIQSKSKVMSLSAIFLVFLGVQGCFSLTVVSEKPNAGKVLVGALEDYVKTNYEVQKEIEGDVAVLEDHVDSHDEDLNELEIEVEALARGELTNCQGLMMHEKCFFLGKRQTNLEGAKMICDENDAKLSGFQSDKDFEAMRDYIRHTDVMAEKQTVYVWTSNHKSDTPSLYGLTDSNVVWAKGYPKRRPGYHFSNIVLRLSFDEIFSDDDGALNVPSTVDGYPLCSMQAIIYNDKCSSHPCKNGATCHNGVTNYTCECRDGYQGDDCDEIETESSGFEI